MDYASIDRLIAQKRRDVAFMGRLQRRLREDRHVLTTLA